MIGAAPYTSANALLVGRLQYRGTPCGLRPATDTLPCLRRATAAGEAPRAPRTTWFRRPIDPADNPYIDQTYRYGATMGGNFQQHQGVEFNNADGTPVLAIGAGTVVHAGRGERDALVVVIRHDTTVTVEGRRRAIFSVYYHNSALDVKVGEAGDRGPADRPGRQHRPRHQRSPAPRGPRRAGGFARARWWTRSSGSRPTPRTRSSGSSRCPGTGIVAGRVLDAAGAPVPGARIYGLAKSEPRETPFSFVETYGDRAHSHPLYG